MNKIETTLKKVETVSYIMDKVQWELDYAIQNKKNKTEQWRDMDSEDVDIEYIEKEIEKLDIEVETYKAIIAVLEKNFSL